MTGAIWGIVAEVMGLILVLLPIPGGPQIQLSFRMAVLSIVLGAIAGGLGYTLRSLQRPS